MFYECNALKKINFFNFNTDNVTKMENTFGGYYSLYELDFSKFNTEKVTNMSEMFCDCSSLKK